MSIGGKTIMSFINDNFMLKNDTAKLLYDKYAKGYADCGLSLPHQPA